MTENRLILSEYGVLGEIFNDWSYSIKPPYWQEVFSSHTMFDKKYSLKPIAEIFKLPNSSKNNFIIAFSLPILEKIRNNLFECSKLAGSVSPFRIIFYLDSMQYHLSSMAEAYLEISNDFQISPLPPSFEYEEKDSFVANHKFCPKWLEKLPIDKLHCFALSSRWVETIFYEMMAFLTSFRSLLDDLVKLMYIIPNFKAKIKRNSFHRLLEKDYPLPEYLGELKKSNKDWLIDAIDYRDCLIHFEMLSPSILPNLFVFHSQKNLVALQTWLPDNPSVNSRKYFTFNNKIEYLSYAYSTNMKTLEFVTKLSSYVLSECKLKLR
jgi:hypothetical protein